MLLLQNFSVQNSGYEHFQADFQIRKLSQLYSATGRSEVKFFLTLTLYSIILKGETKNHLTFDLPVPEYNREGLLIL